MNFSFTTSARHFPISRKLTALVLKHDKKLEDKRSPFLLKWSLLKGMIKFSKYLSSFFCIYSRKQLLGDTKKTHKPHKHDPFFLLGGLRYARGVGGGVCLSGLARRVTLCKSSALTLPRCQWDEKKSTRYKVGPVTSYIHGVR